MTKTTLVDKAEYVDRYVPCSCCKLRLHVYMYPLNNKTGIRSTTTCIACQRDCRGRQSCNLSRLWGCAACKLDTSDSPHPVVGHGGTQYLID